MSWMDIAVAVGFFVAAGAFLAALFAVAVWTDIHPRDEEDE